VKSGVVLGLGFTSTLLSTPVSCNGAVQPPPSCTPSPGTICGIFTAYKLPGKMPHGFNFDPSGKLMGLWFTNRTTDATSGIVNFIPAGGSKLYRTPTAGSEPGSINYAPDYSLWFTESNANRVATMGPARVITEFAVPTPHSGLFDITRGPNGNMWFTEVGVGRIGHLTTAGTLRHFSAGSQKLSGGLTVATDGALWFGQESQVGRLTADGKLTEFNLPAGVYQTGAVFGGAQGGILIGVIKRDGQGGLVSVTRTGVFRCGRTRGLS
jgi:virginiamycin B lyase